MYENYRLVLALYTTEHVYALFSAVVFVVVGVGVSEEPVFVAKIRETVDASLRKRV